MESRGGRKRPWKEEHWYDVQVKRRDSTVSASAALASSPLPAQAGYFAWENDTCSDRILPPLHAPNLDTSTAFAITEFAQRFPQAQELPLLDTPRARARSLFHNLEPLHCREKQMQYAEHPSTHSRTIESDVPAATNRTEVHRPFHGTVPTPHAAGVVAVGCCPSSCQGQACSSARTLMRKLTVDLTLLITNVKTITHIKSSLLDESSKSKHLHLKDSILWALDLVRCATRNLQVHLEQRSSHPCRSQSRLEATRSMRRGQQYLEEREEQPSLPRQNPPHHEYTSYVYTGLGSEEHRRNPHGSDMAVMRNPPQLTTQLPGSGFMLPQSPMHAPQPIRSAILPSPASLTFQNPQTLPSISPPGSSIQSSAQGAHLQDLQHQISLKTLAFQTLQHEYDNLLQKLERQRNQYATLERKFEVSDAEITNLIDEKERLHAQVGAMEIQIEELQHSRDEARSQLAAQGAQYMRIMEMASRLQAQGAEDKKRWDGERKELEQRIKLLEEAMVTGAEQPTLDVVPRLIASPSTPSATPSQSSVVSGTSQTETINVLRAEVGRLRSRTRTLESAQHTMRTESVSIQAAARQVVELGNRLEIAAQSVIGEGG